LLSSATVLARSFNFARSLSKSIEILIGLQFNCLICRLRLHLCPGAARVVGISFSIHHVPPSSCQIENKTRPRNGR
jgi:hypothetical protein